MNANRTSCLSNQRQIGLAILMYAGEHHGNLPATTHSTGVRYNRRTEEWSNQEAWINQIAPYVNDVDKIRVCPAEPPERQKAILEKTRSMEKATSYVLNELVFDLPDPELARIDPANPVFYNNTFRIPYPARTAMMFILSEDKPITATWDHAHCSEWTRWQFVCNDIEVDRHRVGKRSADRTKGSTNILYADGHAVNISAAALKKIVDSGINPAIVPTRP